MSRVTDLSAVVVVTRHCTELDCGKCRAQYRWMRRRAWRSRKSLSRRATGRK